MRPVVRGDTVCFAFQSRVVAQGGSWIPPAFPRSRRIGLDREPVVRGVPEFLLAAGIVLGRLNRHAPKQELDQVQFTARQVTEQESRPIPGALIAQRRPSWRSTTVRAISTATPMRSITFTSCPRSSVIGTYGVVACSS